MSEGAGREGTAWQEVHERILGEHRVLRAMTAEVQRLVERFERGDPASAEPLRGAARDLYLRFEAHLSLEDAVLVPALRRLRGAAAAEALRREHAGQRELLDFLLRRLVLPDRPATLLARELVQFGLLLHEDIVEEERLMAAVATAGIDAATEESDADR
jgi:hypothetical protein